MQLYRFESGDMPPIHFTRSVEFSNNVRLLGHNLNRTAFRPGEEITLDLFWIADNAVDRSYTVFVHVISPGGRTVAQSDSIPANGCYPTNFWAIGGTVWDTHYLQLSDDIEPGEYEIITGLYYWEDGMRVEITEGDADRVNSVVPLGLISVDVNTQGNSDDS